MDLGLSDSQALISPYQVLQVRHASRSVCVCVRAHVCVHACTCACVSAHACTNDDGRGRLLTRVCLEKITSGSYAGDREEDLQGP